MPSKEIKPSNKKKCNSFNENKKFLTTHAQNSSLLTEKHTQIKQILLLLFQALILK